MASTIDNNHNSNEQRDSIKPVSDTINWESILFASWFPRLLLAAYYWIFNVALKPLRLSEEQFQCVCGTETSYWPDFQYSVFNTSTTRCSNELCPMVHYCRLNERESILEPKNYIQCPDCGEVESEHGYDIKQYHTKLELLNNKWIPDSEEWSDQLGRSGSAIPLTEYGKSTPSKTPEDLASVEVLESLCMNCWLKQHGADPDRLRQEAQNRKESDKLPYNHKQRQAAKRRQKQRYLRYSILPIGLLAHFLMIGITNQLGVSESVSIPVIATPTKILALSLGVVTLNILNLLIIITVGIGFCFWTYRLLLYMTGGVMVSNNTTRL